MTATALVVRVKNTELFLRKTSSKTDLTNLSNATIYHTKGGIGSALKSWYIDYLLENHSLT